MRGNEERKGKVPQKKKKDERQKTRREGLSVLLRKCTHTKFTIPKHTTTAFLHPSLSLRGGSSDDDDDAREDERRERERNI